MTYTTRRLRVEPCSDPRAVRDGPMGWMATAGGKEAWGPGWREGEPMGADVSGESHDPTTQSSVHLRSGRAVRFTLTADASATQVRVFRRTVLTTLEDHPVKQVVLECWRQEPETDGVMVWRPWVGLFGGWES